MELPELKAIAKERRPKIKHYYIMSRAQLIQVLLMEKLPPKMILEKKTLKQLQAEAKEKGIPKVWSLRRHELVDILYPTKTESESLDEKKV
jgi:Rho termination factor, N-terminal domain